ncbi:MAG: peptidoglycan-binding protein, partial [Pseudomonadota bacterium]
MADVSILKALFDTDSSASILKRGGSDHDQISILQEILHHLGFGKLLNWDRFGPDGDYGASTAAAVKDFADRNAIASDGSFVSGELGEKLLDRYDFLDEMQNAQDAINKPAVMKVLYRGSSEKIPITVLQNFLHELGFAAEMNWEKYGADGDYGSGTTKAVKALAGKVGVASDGTSVTRELVEQMVDTFSGFYGPDWYDESPKLVRQALKITESDKTVTVSDGVDTKKFGKFSKGLFTYGSMSIGAFISDNKATLKAQGMTDSALNIMIGVSENEGKLDAINTWDNAFMTFGCFQWTIGVGKGQGELPALFKKIKAADADVFERFYGTHGLDVWPKTSATTGFLVLNGQVVNSTAEKAQFRKAEWCFRFWKAGRNHTVQAVSVDHAHSRIHTFARSKGYQVHGHDVADIVTSEFGMALVLDNHVNR